ncbi:MAG TPA: hypothetical protein VII49_08925 [Rhizomicrobium sp.]
MNLGSGVGLIVPKRRALGWRDGMFLSLIAAMPLLASPPMATSIFGIDSLRLYNILPALALIAFVTGSRILPNNDRLERNAFYAFLGYALFVACIFARSVPNLPAFHATWPKFFPVSVRKYAMTDFLLPITTACSFLYVLRRMSSAEGIALTVDAIVIALFAVSTVVMLAIAYDPAPLFSTDPGRRAILQLVNDTLGMHYNAIGTILATAAPLLLYMALKRGSFWALTYGLALAAVLVTKSRTGLFTFVGISAVTMIVLGRARTLLASGPVLGAAALLILGPVLISLVTIGFTQKSGISLWLLLSGRETVVWLPVIFEWSRDPFLLFFGAGFHGIVNSTLIDSGATGFVTAQAHNLYLEFFLDNGIILFVAFLAAIGAWLVWAWRLGKRVQSQLYWSLYLCLASFLISGLSGRLYYPDIENYLMFPIMATLINVARLKLQQDPSFGARGTTRRDRRN